MLNNFSRRKYKVNNKGNDEIKHINIKMKEVENWTIMDEINCP